MTFKMKYEKAKRWQRRVYIMALFHHFALIRDSHWTLIRTAEYFGVSKSLVSENLKLSLSLNKLKEIKTRREALVIIK